MATPLSTKEMIKKEISLTYLDDKHEVYYWQYIKEAILMVIKEYLTLQGKNGNIASGEFLNSVNLNGLTIDEVAEVYDYVYNYGYDYNGHFKDWNAFVEVREKFGL